MLRNGAAKPGSTFITRAAVLKEVLHTQALRKRTVKDDGGDEAVVDIHAVDDVTTTCARQRRRDRRPPRAGGRHDTLGIDSSH